MVLCVIVRKKLIIEVTQDCIRNHNRTHNHTRYRSRSSKIKITSKIKKLSMQLQLMRKNYMENYWEIEKTEIER